MALHVEREADRQRMHDEPPSAERNRSASRHATDIRIFDFMPADGDGSRMFWKRRWLEETLTIRLPSMVRPDMRSAASTARRIDCSAASMSTMTPDLMTPRRHVSIYIERARQVEGMTRHRPVAILQSRKRF